MTKRLIAVGLLLNGCLLGGRFWQEIPRAQAGPPVGPATDERFCADANGDGEVNLSDPITILGWLFLDDEPPYCVERGDGLLDPAELAACKEELAASKTELASCETEVTASEADLATCERELEAAKANLAVSEANLALCRSEGILALCGSDPEHCRSLPATGQTICFNQDGARINCTSGTCGGQDGRYQTGCPNEGRFVDNGDGTVSDNCTGLMWQKDVGNDGDRVNWCGALAYCQSLELGGHSDWRLPNVREFHSIVDYGRVSPAMDPVFDGSLGWYWSSTSVVGVPGPTNGWQVDSNVGLINRIGKRNPAFVRAVRSGR